MKETGPCRLTKHTRNLTRVLFLGTHRHTKDHSPAHHVADDVGVAHQQLVGVFGLSGRRAVEELPERGFNASTVGVELLGGTIDMTFLVGFSSNLKANVKKLYEYNTRRLTAFSGRQWPTGGSGGMGAPSLNRSVDSISASCRRYCCLTTDTSVLKLFI